MSGLVLSLFPGIGLLDMAFEEEGFCVVRGPDLLWGGDVRGFHPPAGKFDGVIGGPPCQAFSSMRHLAISQGYAVAENRIPEFERCVAEARPDWFVMENVPEAPLPVVAGYVVRPQGVRDVWVGGETNRFRRFSFGTRDGRALDVAWLALHRPDPAPAVLAGQRLGETSRTLPNGKRAGPHRGKRAPLSALCVGQGLPADFLADAPFTQEGKRQAVGNGVPLPMGRAIARAVKAAISTSEAA